MKIRVLRVYHGGRDLQHRGRERALAAAGVDVTLVVPEEWPDPAPAAELAPEPFRIVQLPVRRAGDVNRHVYADPAAVRRILDETQPDVLDIHEEPVSLATRQWLRGAPPDLPIVMYTAQNIDKRYPPPFARYERDAYARVDGVYPCSRQAAAVARGKGFAGVVDVLPLAFDPSLYGPGVQSANDVEVVLGFVGRFVSEKGLRDAVDVLAAVNRVRPARLLAIGGGPEGAQALRRSARLGLRGRVEIHSWRSGADLASLYRRMHVVLVPSIATPTWAEQFGRVAIEAQASGAVVAAYESGALPEVVGEPGLLAPERDVGSLAAAVVRVLADPDDFERRRRDGLALSEGRSWTTVAERQAELYECVLRSRFRPAATGRAAALAEFGPTADTPAGRRPFALPVLRHAGARLTRRA